MAGQSSTVPQAATVDDATRRQLGQLSPEYWNRVGREAAIQRAASPGNVGVAKARAIDAYLAPPGRPDNSSGLSQTNYCKGGKVISTKEM